jgi:hypothetical protein
MHNTAIQSISMLPHTPRKRCIGLAGWLYWKEGRDESQEPLALWIQVATCATCARHRYFCPTIPLFPFVRSTLHLDLAPSPKRPETLCKSPTPVTLRVPNSSPSPTLWTSELAHTARQDAIRSRRCVLPRQDPETLRWPPADNTRVSREHMMLRLKSDNILRSRNEPYPQQAEEKGQGRA